MGPIVFKEQLNESTALLDETVDFNLFKIDFKNLLGIGLYGHVYPLVKRPIVEQSWLMRRFTCFYDLTHPSNVSDEQTEYCIKMFKPIPYVLAKISYFTLRNYLSNPCKLACDTFSTKAQEYASHKLLVRYRLTSMKFYNGGGWWGQVKTKVSGKTLENYCHTKEFIAKKSFQLRLQLYHFFINISMSPLIYYDVHARNLMFSLSENQWLIVDGAVQELKKNDTGQKEKNRQARAVASDLSKSLGLVEKRLIFVLYNMAIRRVPYSEDHDSILLKNIHQCMDDSLIENKNRLFAWNSMRADLQQETSLNLFCY